MDKLPYNSYKDRRVQFWDAIWSKPKGFFSLSNYYHKILLRIYKFIIPENCSVLEIGCGNGKLLAGLINRERTGIDFSSKAIELSKDRCPEADIFLADIYDFNPGKKFDYLILSDFLGDIWDIELALKKIRGLCHPKTRLVINYYSKLWELPLRFGQFFGLKKKNLAQNWISTEDIKNLLYLADFEPIKKWEEILLPANIPVISWLLNRFIVKLPIIRYFSLVNFMVARMKPRESQPESDYSVSVIVAARNEVGHIAELFDRLPNMGKWTELIFVEGGSSDNTYEVIEEEIKKRGNSNTKLLRQSGKGKGNAVREGFDAATGDILMILDADLTVPPEKLPLFYQALSSGKGDFINGVRLVYPMEKKAMRFFNLVGNKFFSMAFSWVLGQSIKDTLCGTKVLLASDYQMIKANRKFFGEFDPFGDFDLIFGAAKLNLKIQDLPIRYMDRAYGTTNISRWRHGFILLRMLIFATFKIRFI